MLISLVFCLSPVTAWSDAGGCEAKKQSIQQQIAYARQHHNSYQETGLKKALAEVEAHCTDTSLQASRDADVRKKVAKVSERGRELDEAKASGNLKKIGNKQKKLEEAQH